MKRFVDPRREKESAANGRQASLRSHQSRPSETFDWDNAIARWLEMLDEIYHPERKPHET